MNILFIMKYEIASRCAVSIIEIIIIVHVSAVTMYVHLSALQSKNAVWTFQITYKLLSFTLEDS